MLYDIIINGSFPDEPEIFVNENLCRFDFLPHTKTVTIDIDGPTPLETFAAARELIVDTDSVNEVLWETATLDRTARSITVIGYNVAGFTHQFTLKNIDDDLDQLPNSIALLALLGFATHLHLSFKLCNLRREAVTVLDRIAV